MELLYAVAIVATFVALAVGLFRAELFGHHAQARPSSEGSRAVPHVPMSLTSRTPRAHRLG